MARSTLKLDIGTNVTLSTAERALRVVEWFLQDNPGVIIRAEAGPAGLALSFAEVAPPTVPVPKAEQTAENAPEAENE